MNTKDKGDISEQKIILDLIQSGYSVSQPVGDNDRYDLILDVGGELYRVQVKTARVDGNSIVFRCDSTYYGKDGSVKSQYTNEQIDMFAAYCPETKDIVYVDVDDAPKTAMRLREESDSARSNVIESFTLEQIVE